LHDLHKAIVSKPKNLTLFRVGCRSARRWALPKRATHKPIRASDNLTSGRNWLMTCRLWASQQLAFATKEACRPDAAVGISDGRNGPAWVRTISREEQIFLH